jgi:hypothetical protein
VEINSKIIARVKHNRTVFETLLRTNCQLPDDLSEFDKELIRYAKKLADKILVAFMEDILTKTPGYEV